MKEILEKYIKSKYTYDFIHIEYFTIDGSNCEVKFYYDESFYYHEIININIWDMLVFLNKE